MDELKEAGKSLEEAKKVAILIHGRGASASSIMSLKESLKLDDFALLAPQASNNSWYPHSFMAADKDNEPAFSDSMDKIAAVVDYVLDAGFTEEQIYFIGFSQGACLSLEYAAQNAQAYGGVIAFTGGLIGQSIILSKYKGDFQGTPIFIGSSQRDMHVPLSRIEESEKLLKEMGASVKTLIFEDNEHTIRQEEIDWVNENILNK